MWQTKYASATPKHLGLGVNSRPCSEDYFLSERPQYVEWSKEPCPEATTLKLWVFLFWFSSSFSSVKAFFMKEFAMAFLETQFIQILSRFYLDMDEI